jgi:hypothetical protein
VIVGATAVGGGDFTVVVLVESVLDVESVTIVSANATDAAVTIAIATKILFMFFVSPVVYIIKTKREHKEYHTAI